MPTMPVASGVGCFLPPMRFRQLSRDGAIERGVVGFPIRVERRGGQLDRVQDVAEVQLRQLGDGLVSQPSAIPW